MMQVSVARGLVAAALVALAAACSAGEPEVAAPASAAETSDAVVPADVAPPPVVAPPPAGPYSMCAPADGSGFCGVSWGVSRKDAIDGFQGELKPLSGSRVSGGCQVLFADGKTDTIAFTFQDDVAGRVEVSVAGPVTQTGVGVGSTMDDLRAAHAQMSEQPDKYDPEIVQYEVLDGPGKLVYRMKAGQVIAWRSGIPPVIDYVEGCG
jgi:hypothetical protein